ncbi:MAG TPA: hypothetical protein VMF91_26270 [Bryobacteraceae bacterium]|nr:hypothetical protein [Bryobacteraceae bacterium]
MTGLHRRLQKLEAAFCGPVWNTQLVDLCDCARRKLSVADRDLLKEAEMLLDQVPFGSLSEAHRAVWDRWEDAFSKAAEEMRFPWLVTAADLRL